jgi:hypothetical protein
MLLRNGICSLTLFWEGGSGVQLVDLLSSIELGSMALCTGADECKKTED